MNDGIEELVNEIHMLEERLKNVIREQQTPIAYILRDKRIDIQRSLKEQHRKVKRNVLKWIVTDRPQNFITGPIIYSLCIPLFILDIFVSIYQFTCFPVYRIAKVKRGDFIVFDKKFLHYLNWFERFHCLYCSYANGLLAYSMEIASRTEQYFCPIKHLHKTLGTSRRYERFLEYGAASNFHKQLEMFRTELEPVSHAGPEPVQNKQAPQEQERNMQYVHGRMPALPSD